MLIRDAPLRLGPDRTGEGEHIKLEGGKHFHEGDGVFILGMLLAKPN
jgi:hypothetical protein